MIQLVWNSLYIYQKIVKKTYISLIFNIIVTKICNTIYISSTYLLHDKKLSYKKL